MSFPEGAFTDFVFGKGWRNTRGIERFPMGEFCIEGCGRLKQRGELCETCYHDRLLTAEPLPGVDPEHDAAVERIARRNGILPPELPNAVMLGPVNAKEIAEALQSYLSSQTCMLLFSKLTLYRACGENPSVKVSYAGKRFRVSLVRSNGEVEHFNRDGKP